MFLRIQRVVRIASADIPGEPCTVLKPELIRADLIQRIRAVDSGGHDEPCTELVLDNEEVIVCQGSFEDIESALSSLF